MSKYDRLAEHLKARSDACIPMRFADIERLVGGPLPPSARKHRPWWSNNPANSPMTRAWLEAGYKTESVDMGGEKLVFRRAAHAHARGRRGDPSRSVFDQIHGALRGTVTFVPGVDLTEPVWDEDED